VANDSNYSIGLDNSSFLGIDEIVKQKLVYNLDENLIVLNIKKQKKEEKVPIKEEDKVKSSFYTILTAYNSEAAQCDSSPCITANGYNLCKYNKEDSVAINNLSFGTKIRIPAVFGDKVFTVRDRMHSKYYNRVDIWMIDKNEAINFGYKRAKVEVID
jgi:3D (Asp-Asp-Asp) domain-containing protein